MSNKNWLKNFIDEEIYVFDVGEISQIQDEKAVTTESDSKEENSTNSAAVVVPEGEHILFKELLNSILSTLDRTIDTVDILSPGEAKEGSYEWVIDFTDDTTNKYALLNNGFIQINSDGLESLSKDRNLKLSLWNTIKELKNLQTAR